LIHILLVDQLRLFRGGLAALLSAEGMRVVGEVADGNAAVAAAAELKPDVCLLELAVRDATVLAATRQITGAGTKVLAMSQTNSKDYLSQALRSGASGYILKDSDPAELVRAVRAVAEGGRHIGADTGTEAPAATPEVSLTPRQREVLQLMAQGRTTREIAGLLTVSVKTVETHRAQLMEKTKIRDVAGLVRLAIRMGLAGL
jgi:DNA-binding NarL/FixJ family response regulator